MFCKMTTQDRLTLGTVQCGGSAVVDSFFIVDPIVCVFFFVFVFFFWGGGGVCVWSLFCNAILTLLSGSAVILLRKRELVALI